jgi:hypothetical protein
VRDTADVRVDLRKDILVDFLTTGTHIAHNVLFDEGVSILTDIHHVRIRERTQRRRKVLVDVYRYAVFFRFFTLIADAGDVSIGKPLARLGAGLVVQFCFNVLLACLCVGKVKFDRPVIGVEDQVKRASPAGKPERGVLLGQIGKLAGDLRTRTG